MSDGGDHKQIELDLTRMDKRLMDLEVRMTSIDSKLTQVVDAILGNALTKQGGFVGEIEVMKAKILTLETKVEEQSDFKKKILWTIGIIVSAAIVLEYLTRMYVNITHKV